MIGNWRLVRFMCVLLMVFASLGEGRAQTPSKATETPAAAKPSLQWSVPPNKQVRLIISSDTANEADDQAAIAYAFLSPTLDIRGLIAAHFWVHSATPVQSAEETMEASYQEMLALLQVMQLKECVPVRRGAAVSLASATEPVASEGADLIIREAHRRDSKPLFVVVLGPMTDLASAYLKDPQLAEHLTAIWIGGAAYPAGGFEYNFYGDPIAANVVMESDIPLWQIPEPVYSRGQLALAEAADRVGRQGELGRFLFDRFRRFVSLFPRTTEFFQYADIPALAVLLQHPWVGDFEMKPAPSITASGHYVHTGKNRSIRVYRSYDQRAVLEDFFAKLAAFTRGELQPLCGMKASMEPD